MKKAAVAGVDDAAKVVVAKARSSMEKRGTRFVASPPGTPPHNQRGGLWNSISHTLPQINNNKVTVQVGSNLAYSRIHELGGTIRAKRGKFLPVPLNDAAKRLQEKSNLRSQKMIVFRLPSGKLMMVGAKKTRYTNKAQGIRINDNPLFILVKSVRMPKRPYMVPALEAARKDGSLYKALFTGTRGAIKQFSAGLA